MTITKSKKIIIIGCGGSGKTSLAIELGKRLQIPVVHLDKLYWYENWQPIPNDEFNKKVKVEIEKEEWIIDGNFDGNIHMRLEACDTVIYLDYSRITCLLGIIKRAIQNHGKTRPDMVDNCPEILDPEVLRWVWRFNNKHRASYLKMLAEEKAKKGITLYIFKTRNECRKFIKTI